MASISFTSMNKLASFTGKPTSDIIEIFTNAQPVLGQINYEVMYWFFVGWFTFIVGTVFIALVIARLNSSRDYDAAILAGVIVGAILGLIVVGWAVCVYSDILIAQRLPEYKTFMDIAGSMSTL